MRHQNSNNRRSENKKSRQVKFLSAGVSTKIEQSGGSKHTSGLDISIGTRCVPEIFYPCIDYGNLQGAR